MRESVIPFVAIRIFSACIPWKRLIQIEAMLQQPYEIGHQVPQHLRRPLKPLQVVNTPDGAFFEFFGCISFYLSFSI